MWTADGQRKLRTVTQETREILSKYVSKQHICHDIDITDDLVAEGKFLLLCGSNYQFTSVRGNLCY